MNFKKDVLFAKKNRKTEAIFISLISMLFFLFVYKILTAQSMLSHDSIRWYGVYHLFADSLLNGIFPYWDPFDSCGQPFYYNLGILRLYEPITVGFIMLQKVFNSSILSIYHWEYIIRIWLVALGVYLCYRQTNKYLLSSCMVFAVFLFSSFAVTCFRQNGVLYVFFWTPLAMYFFLKLLKDFSLYNVIGFSFFIGLSLINYQGVYILTYLFIFILTLLINKRKYLISVFKNAKNLVRIFAGIIVVVILALPLLGIYIEKDKIIPSVRLRDKAEISEGINLAYDSIEKAGTHSNIADFLELVFPPVARGYFWHWFPVSGAALSECFLYIGIFPLVLGILGAVKSRQEYRKNFLITLVLVGLLMLGPKYGIHRLIYFLFYPLRVTRHMHLFAGFFIFTLLYFVGQGIDFVIDNTLAKFTKDGR